MKRYNILSVNLISLVFLSFFLLCSARDLTRVQKTAGISEYFSSREGRKHKEFLKTKKEDNEVTYVGAVIEYEPYNVWTDEERGYGIVRKNAEAFAQYAKQAKSEFGADILIAPEYGMTSLKVLNYEHVEDFITFTQYIPDPSAEGATLCYQSDASANNHLEGLQIISCAAIDNQMYLVVNVAEMFPCSAATVAEAPWQFEPLDTCPDNGYFFYNCEIVFDRKGVIVARYRKEHLFLEDAFTPGPMEDTTAIFLTDFNVLFSLQVCFDIAFEHPGYDNAKYHGIRDVAMSTAWVDYLPFETADVVQNGWSRGLKTNLLVSGYHLPEKGKVGSGIFRGYSGDLPAYTYDKDSGNVLVAATVTTIKATELLPHTLTPNINPMSEENDPRTKKEIFHVSSSSKYKDETRRHLMFHENLKDYTKILLNQTVEGPVSTNACYGDFCCNLSYEYSGDEVYMFVVYSGKFTVGSRYSIGKQVCAIVWCQTSDSKTCGFPEIVTDQTDSFGPFSIDTSHFSAELVVSVGNRRNLSLINNDQLNFEKNGKQYIVSSKQTITNPMVAGLYGRWYCEDGLK